MKTLRLYFIGILLAMSSITFGQKNEFGVYYNYLPGQFLTKVSNLGIRYSREIKPKFRISLGFDRQNNFNSHSFYQGLKAGTMTGIVVIDKSVSYVYTDNVIINNLDMLIDYNILKSKSKLYVRPTFGLTAQLLKTKNVPLVEIVDYEIVNSIEVVTKKKFILPKLGMSAGYKVKENLSVGIDLFYRSILGNKNKLILSNKTTSVSHGITFYDGNGGYSTVGEGSGWSLSEVFLGAQTGIGIHVNIKF